MTMCLGSKLEGLCEYVQLMCIIICRPFPAVASSSARKSMQHLKCN